MSVKEQREYDIVSRVILGDLTMVAAAGLLDRSYRQTQRMVLAVKQEGMLGPKHGNLGKTPWNKISSELKAEVLRLLSERYPDFNLQHFAEKLSTEHNIAVKRETLRKWAHELVKRAHHYQNRRKKIHRTRHRMPRAGMLLQMDGSTHEWFGSGAMPACLVGNIDDATSLCPYGEFFPVHDRRADGSAANGRAGGNSRGALRRPSPALRQ
jgi:transposase